MDTQHSSAKKSVTFWGWKRAEEVKRQVGSAPSRTSQYFQLFCSAAPSLGGHPLHSQPSSPQWPPCVGGEGQLVAPPSVPAPPLLYPPPRSQDTTRDLASQPDLCQSAGTAWRHVQGWCPWQREPTVLVGAWLRLSFRARAGDFPGTSFQEDQATFPTLS